MAEWMLVSNCQTFGLANCLMMANPELRVTGVDIWTHRADPARYCAEMQGYERILIHPDVAACPEFVAARHPCVNYLPSLEFGAYHPDNGYFLVDDVFVVGPMATYQSVIAVAAYQLGLSLGETRALFTGRTYDACGYLDDWVPQRDFLVRSFANHGIAIADAFPRWGREQAFMLSINHPRIAPLWDVACSFLHALGLATLDTDMRPMDNMLPGSCMPVYPEIGEALGVRGSYLFKPTGDHRLFDLDHFLGESFKAFDAFPRGAIRPWTLYQERFDRVLATIGGRA